MPDPTQLPNDDGYTPDQQRVADYLLEITDHQIGAGDDPIGFLIASHAALAHRNKQAKGHVVTDEMVDRACDAHWEARIGDHGTYSWADRSRRDLGWAAAYREDIRAALEAALNG